MSFGLTDSQFSGPFHVILYGKAGARKTLSMLTAIKPLLINLENKVSSLIEYRAELDSQSRVYTPLGDANREANPGLNDLELFDLYMYGNKAINGDIPGLIPILKTEKAKEHYNTLFFDSLSVWGDIVEKNTPEPKNGWEKWPNMEAKFMGVMNDLMDLGYNVVFLSQRATEKRQKLNDKGKLVAFDHYNMKALNKKIPFALAHIVDNMFYMDTIGEGREAKIVVHTDSSDTHEARCAKQKALNPMETFNIDGKVGWDMIFDKVRDYDAKHSA